MGCIFNKPQLQQDKEEEPPPQVKPLVRVDVPAVRKKTSAVNVPDHNLSLVLHFLSIPDALRTIITCRAFLSASITPSYCHPLLHLAFVPSQLECSDSNSDSSSDEDEDEVSQHTEMKWWSVVLFCQRRRASIHSLRISPPDGVCATIVQLSELCDSCTPTQFQIHHGPFTVLKPIHHVPTASRPNVLQELAKEASRIVACQKSYDSEYYHEFNVNMVTNVPFLQTGGNVEEANSLLCHIENAVCSYLHSCTSMGAASTPYGRMQGWVSRRRQQLKEWLPVQETYTQMNQRMHRMRACRLSGDRVRHLMRAFREMKQEFSKFLIVVPPSEITLHQQVGWTEREREAKKQLYAKDPTTSPYNLMREEVLLPWICTTINDLARVNEMLDTLENGNGKEDIEHWMMLDSADREMIGQWSGHRKKSVDGGGSDGSVDSDDDLVGDPIGPRSNGNSNHGHFSTIGQALDTLRSDPNKFKAFTEMTRHMNEMMRLDA